jgi:hypothetical protein
MVIDDSFYFDCMTIGGIDNVRLFPYHHGNHLSLNF